MANEFKHKDPGTELTQAEFIASDGTGHIFESQAQGDVLFASSTTELTRLGKDANATRALTNTGTNNNPAWAQIALATGVSGTLPVGNGGTGATTLTDGGVLIGNSTGAIVAMAVLADSEMIVGDGTTDPVAESGATLRTSIGVGTGDSPQFTGIELGHASDTTIVRSGSGAITVEGNQVYLAGGTDVALGDGGTGASLSDPGADRLMFWDDSAGAVAFLTASTNLTISGTNITASGGIASVAADGSPELGANLDALNYDICNVGHASSVWDENGINIGVTSTGGAEILDLINTSNTAGAAAYITWSFTDAGCNSVRHHQIRVNKDDNTAGSLCTRMDFHSSHNGSCNKTVTINSPGCLLVDLGASGGSVGLFDSYDDPIEIQRYAHSVAEAPTIAGITIEQRDANRDRMVELGILYEKDTGSGYMMNIQPLTRLLAGGIYQNRSRIDEYHLCHERRIQELEAKFGGCSG